jgi:hypothetical protein
MKQNHLMIFHPHFQGALGDLAKNGLGTEKGQRARKYMQTAVQAFLEGVSKLGVDKKVADLQAFTSSADIPDPQFAFDSFVKVSNWDNRYENAFKVRTFDNNKGTFSIVTISNGGFVFDQLPQGGTVTVRRFDGNSIDVRAVTYADAVGWYWEMVEDRMFSEMVDMLGTMAQQFFASKSKNHYRLLTDASFDTSNGNASVAWQGVGSDPLLTRDRLTLSKMVNDVALAVKDSGYGDVAVAQYDLYCQPLLAQRIADALNPQLGGANGIGNIPAFNIRINPTYNLNRSSGSVLATDAILVLSGNKIQRGDKVSLTSYQTTDNLSASEIVVGRARYGAAVADPKQTIKGAFA